MSYALDVIREDPILVNLIRHYKKVALAQRERYSTLTGQFQSDYMRACSAFPSIMEEIEEMENQYFEMMQNAGGAPDTEGVFDGNLKESRDPDKAAERFLLKKAYRAAASVAHPDKQGGSAEEFALLNAAYKDGDLDSIQAYYLSRLGTVEQRLHFWFTESVKPRVQWQKFTSTVQYQVVVLRMQGNFAKANNLVRQALHQTQLELAEKIVQFIERKSHGKA